MSPLWRGRMRRARLYLTDPIVAGIILIGIIAAVSKAFP